MDLVPEHMERSSPSAADITFGDDTSILLAMRGDPDHLDDEPSLGGHELQGGAVEVADGNTRLVVRERYAFTTTTDLPGRDTLNELRTHDAAAVTAPCSSPSRRSSREARASLAANDSSHLPSSVGS
jgi:hypothetical protein